MENNVNLYKQADFQEFSFYKDINHIFDTFSVDGVISNQYIILKYKKDEKIQLIGNSGYMYIENIKADNFHIIDDANLKKHGIYVTKINFIMSDKCYCTDYMELCHLILKSELEWFNRFFEWINRYLSKRVSDNKYLTSHDPIKISMAEVIENLCMAKTTSDIFLQSRKKLDVLQAMARHIEIGIKKLADCAGGRGFTGGNILELYWLSLLLNQFLLGEIK